LHVAVERELTYYEQTTPDVTKRPIHLAFIVAENTKADHLLRHPAQRSFGVVGLESTSNSNP
jgi:hypothetical protein